MDTPRPVFIHYKIFDADTKETLRSLHPFGYANDPYIGRVDAFQIPTPHTVSALVERICKRENRGFGLDWATEDAYGTVLFKSAATAVPYELDDTIDLLGAGRPGLTPRDPVILQVDYKDFRDVFPQDFAFLGLGGTESPFPPVKAQDMRRNPLYRSQQEPVFVHYKLYDADRKEMITSLHPVEDANDYCVGRVDAAEIPTPHTAGVLIERICERENRPMGVDWDHDDAYGTLLLKRLYGPEQYKMEDTIDLLGDGRPGLTPQDPAILKVWCKDIREVFGFPGWDE
ncbi:hypothetical protein FB451DRAFT_1554124 [Mycena latifolia]|nr:hypothetical protein FB451DRAFT_1554124 [Mycena latifolia]